MHFFKLYFKVISTLFFVILFFSTLQAKNVDKFNDGKIASNYFSGILLLKDNQHNDSYKFLKKLNGLEDVHPNFSIKYLNSMVILGKIEEAYKYSKKLERKKLDSYDSNLIIGVFHLKNEDYDLARKYFEKLREKSYLSLNKFISNSLIHWSSLKYLDLNSASIKIDSMEDGFGNFKLIQRSFLHCYFDSKKTNNFFKSITSNSEIDYSRYNYFYANYLVNTGKIEAGKKILKKTIKNNPRNLLNNQFLRDLENSKKRSIFNCKNQNHIIAEIFYITANALSSQGLYATSNFYLSLAKQLNEKFYSFDSLLAENYFETENFKEARKVLKTLETFGQTYYWYSAKQFSRILLKQKKKEKAIKSLKNAYSKLSKKNVYDSFDFAEFLKNNEKFDVSIKYYSEVLGIIDKNHPLYPEATDGRGVAFERMGDWEKAEKDLLASLKVKPNQAYVINYLAYSWIEKSIKIEKSLEMLKKANTLKENDPYIIDSLGWALYKLQRYKEAKEYLQRAVQLMPADPIVNDHYGDVLWKNGNEIQARYYWNYVLGLEDTEEKLKNNLKIKLISGL